MRTGKFWPGWATVESEPAIFEQLLKKIGVHGVSVEEVYSLDEESLQDLKPIYGLIFLFRWKEEQDENQPELVCPTDIWFANQVFDNACASLALLNIVLNIETVDIGERLTAFKEFTRDFTPPLRGVTLTNFDYLRTLHNTFARKSEMANSDYALMESMRQRSKRGYTEDSAEDEEDCFHFIAYIYKRGHLWELDGLKKTPVRLGQCSSTTWTACVAPQIHKRMERYARDEIRFNLLALCQDPVIALRERLENAERDLEIEDDTTMITSLECDIHGIKSDIADRGRREQANEVYVSRRRHDYGEFCQQMLKFLNDKGVLSSVIGA